MKKLTEKTGFTLIEVLVAIVVLTIGVMALYAMQTTAIKGNATAISLTTGSNWAQDRVELLLSKNYTHADLQDTDNDECAGLNDLPPGNDADHSDTSDEFYEIYWNVADKCSLTQVPGNQDHEAPPEDVQSPKHIRVFVIRKDQGIKKTIEFNYIKQNTI